MFLGAGRLGQGPRRVRFWPFLGASSCDCHAFRLSIPALSIRRNRQRQLRGMTSIVVDGLLRYLQLGVLSEGVSGVWVAVVHREVAARDLQPNAVTGLEEVRGRPDVDRV